MQFFNDLLQKTVDLSEYFFTFLIKFNLFQYFYFFVWNENQYGRSIFTAAAATQGVLKCILLYGWYGVETVCFNVDVETK